MWWYVLIETKEWLETSSTQKYFLLFEINIPINYSFKIQYVTEIILGSVYIVFTSQYFSSLYTIQLSVVSRVTAAIKSVTKLIYITAHIYPAPKPQLN